MMDIIAHYGDGSCRKLRTIPSNYNIEVWVEENHEALELLGITRLETIEL